MVKCFGCLEPPYGVKLPTVVWAFIFQITPFQFWTGVYLW